MNRRTFLAASGFFPGIATEIEKEDHSATAWGFSNGRRWAGWNEDERTIFVLGLSEGAAWAIRDISRRLGPEGHKTVLAVLSGFLSGETTISELAEGVNVFYRDPANLNIGAADALAVFIARIKGGSPQQIETWTARLRRQNAP